MVDISIYLSVRCALWEEFFLCALILFASRLFVINTYFEKGLQIWFMDKGRAFDFMDFLEEKLFKIYLNNFSPLLLKLKKSKYVGTEI